MVAVIFLYYLLCSFIELYEATFAEYQNLCMRSLLTVSKKLVLFKQMQNNFYFNVCWV